MSVAESVIVPQASEPVLDYISSMSDELAALARSIGDPRLAMLLDLAATFAERRPRVA